MRYTILAILFIFACSSEKNDSVANHSTMMNNELKPPVAHKEPQTLTIHDDTRMDEYYWMRLTDDQKNAREPDDHARRVIDYLNAENDYTSAMTAHLEGFKEDLYNEIIGRIKQTDISVPYKDNGYFYLTRYEEGKEYPVQSRKKGNLEADEEIMLDINEMAIGYDYYDARSLNVSPDNTLLCFGEDTLSRRIYTLRFKDLTTGRFLEDQIPNTTGYAVWANDNKTVFYTVKDEALRAYKIFRHILGTSFENDVEVFHETDETFSCFVSKTKSRKYIVIGSYATLSNEYRFIPADQPLNSFKLFQERERKLEHDIYHFDDKWFIRTNKDGAQNFKLMVTPENATSSENWKDFIPHRDEAFLTDIEIFTDFLVVNERVDGITKIRIRPWDKGQEHYIDFGEAAYMSYTTTNREFDTDEVRIYYSSLTIPGTTYDYNMTSRTLNLMKRQEVVGDFNPDDYQSERLIVTARDGARVPVSLVYRKGYKKDGRRPLLLYGYGSYGYSLDPYFSSVRLSLLDRGFVFAIAHIRGGQEMGRQWYEDGKFFKKKNTFMDFIDVADHLVEEKYTGKENLFAMGGSAGGLLIGAVINMRPDLWKGVIAAVPFVDVVTTMLDESIPLTTGEYDEWGNPNEKAYYDYMKSYSPYDNVTEKDYPAMLVTTGFFDSQVQYWEPAKWVAKLRDMKTDNNPILLHCDMDVGHGGKSGRFQRYRETALEYAFLLDLAGKTDVDIKG